ncbi:MAG: cobalamin B12-binding domain-containing protein [Pseudomonadota bacterium]
MNTSATSTVLDRNALSRALDVYHSQRRKLDPDALRSVASEVFTQLSRRLRMESLPAGSPDLPLLDRFCDALVGEDDLAGTHMISEAQADGASMDAIYLGYLGEAARRLGERWEADQISFWQMTVAAGRIYVIMRGLRHHFAPPAFDVRRHALFSTMPGDQHTLGVSIAADLFRARGWDIQLMFPSTQEELVAGLERSDHVIIGVSASRPGQLVALAKLVIALRVARPYGHIIVSGHIVSDEPDVMELVDADGFASSAPAAIDKLERLITETRRSAAVPAGE